MTENRLPEELCEAKKQRNMRIFQAATLVFLLLLWIGYFRSLRGGSDSQMSWYSLSILMFSLYNANALFCGEKMQHRALTILARAEGVLLIVWAVITMVQLVLK